MKELIKAIMQLMARVHELERRVGADKWEGKVSHADPSTHKYRVQIGTDPEGQPVYSAWGRNPQMSGALKGHTPMNVGQPASVEVSAGDMQQATVRPGQWNDDNSSPSTDGGSNSWTFGDVRVDLTDSGILVTIGGTTFSLTASGFLQTGGSVEHNGTNIGDDHKHLGVVSGPNETGVPS